MGAAVASIRLGQAGFGTGALEGIVVGAAVDKILLGQAGFGMGAFVVEGLGNEVGDTVGANDGDGLLQLVGILVGAAVDKILLGQAGIGTGAFVVAELGSRDGDEDEGRSVYLYDCTKGAMLGAACLYEGLRHDGGTLPRGTG